MGDKKNRSFITSTLITLVIIAMLILSGPIAEAVRVTITADKTEVRAGDAAENKINFTVWVNLSNPDAYVPLQRVYLNLSGNSSRSYSFNLDGSNIQGQAFSGEITVTPGGSFGSNNSGFGYGYDFNTGNTINFGYGYGYGYSGASFNRSYDISLNTSRMFDGSYTATFNAYAAGSSTAYSFTSTSYSFTILPRLVSTTIPALPANNQSTSGVISTPVGNYEWVVVTNGTTIPVTLNVTVSVAPPSGSTNISSLFAGAIPDLYFNISVNNSAWFSNLSHVQFKAYYNESKIPANIAESTLRAYRYTGGEWKRLDCADLGGCNAALADGTVVYATGVDTTNNFVFANLSRFSTFAIAGTVSAAAAAAGGPSGGGGGGGGGVSSAEPYENIQQRESREEFIQKDQPVKYKFITPELPISEITITSNINAGLITVSVELLKDTSKLVKENAPGTVYKNVNIWVGTSGFAVPKNIKEAIINFKVENSWIKSKQIESEDVKMLRWDGSKWILIDTTEISKDAEYSYYEAKTDTFSPFAISGVKGIKIPTATPMVPETPAVTPTPTIVVPSKPINWLLIIGIIAIIIIAVVVYMSYTKRSKK